MKAKGKRGGRKAGSGRKAKSLRASTRFLTKQRGIGGRVFHTSTRGFGPR